MPRPTLSKTTTNNVVKPAETVGKNDPIAVQVNRLIGMAGEITVEPDDTLQIHERVVDVRYGTSGTIFGFYKDEKPDKEGHQQDLVAVSFDKLYQTDWGLMKVAFVPRNQILREAEWKKLKGENHDTNPVSTR